MCVFVGVQWKSIIRHTSPHATCNHGNKSKPIPIRPSPRDSAVVTGSNTVPHNSPTHPWCVSNNQREWGSPQVLRKFRRHVDPLLLKINWPPHRNAALAPSRVEGVAPKLKGTTYRLLWMSVSIIGWFVALQASNWVRLCLDAYFVFFKLYLQPLTKLHISSSQ